MGTGFAITTLLLKFDSVCSATGFIVQGVVMSIFTLGSSKNGGTAVATLGSGGEKLYGELYFEAKSSLQLLFIYNKIEQAAESGDWSLLNRLYEEFRITQASLN